MLPVTTVLCSWELYPGMLTILLSSLRYSNKYALLEPVTAVRVTLA